MVHEPFNEDDDRALRGSLRYTTLKDPSFHEEESGEEDDTSELKIQLT